MLITVTILDQDKPKEIKCQKVLSKEFYQKTKDKLLKEGSMIYPAKMFDRNNIGNNETIFVSRNQEIVKELKDAKYVIETKKATKMVVSPIPKEIIKKEEPLPEVKLPIVVIEEKKPDLTTLLEEKKEKIEATIKAEEKEKVDSEKDKLQMELLKAKVALINEWIRANKE